MATRTGPDSSSSHDDVQPLPTRRIWPWFVVITLVLGSAGGWLFLQWRAPQPLRVLVAIEMDGHWWQGSKAAARLADELGTLLDGMGFEAVRAGDPKTVSALETATTPVEAAEILGAAFVITGKLTPRRVELPVEEGFVQVAVDDSIRVQHVNEDAPFATLPISTFAGANDEEQALVFAAESVARHAAEVVVVAIAAHPSVASLLAGQDAKLLDRLAPTKAFVAGREAEMGDAARAYADLSKRRTSGEERGPLTFHSDTAANDRLVAVGPRGLLVAKADVTPFYSLARLELLRSEQLEVVAWWPLDAAAGTQAPALWRGYNAFTYPSVSADGRTVVIVEDLYGWGRSLLLLREGEPPKRLRTDAKRKLSEPRLSPSGRLVAYVDRACGGCARELAVVDDRGTEQLRLADKDAVVGGFAWLGDAHLVVAWQPSANDAPSLWSIGLGGEREQLLPLPSDAIGRTPAVSGDGRSVAVAVPSQAQIRILDRSTGDVSMHLVGGAASAIHASKDGGLLVFELLAPSQRDHEIALLDVGSDDVRLLTTNDAADRSPALSPDESRVFFEARDRDPVFGRARALSRIASVAIGDGG
jgi:TolB protein